MIAAHTYKYRVSNRYRTGMCGEFCYEYMFEMAFRWDWISAELLYAIYF